MRRLALILACLCLLAPQAAAYEVIGGPWPPPAAAGTTIWESETWESNPANWYDQFDANDHAPADFSVDATSQITGTYSLKLFCTATGGVRGDWTFAETEFYWREKILISGTSAPEDGDAIVIAGCANSATTAGNVYLIYTGEVYKVNVEYAPDTGGVAYVVGTTITEGITLSTDTVYTIDFYHNSGAGDTGGVNGIQVDEGGWTNDTGLNIDGRTYAAFMVQRLTFAGTVDADDWVVYRDDMLLQDTDPSL